MNTHENRTKLRRSNGARALAKLVGEAPPAARPEPNNAPTPWIQPGVVSVGIQGPDGFRALQNMSILSISREYRRRFAALGEQAFCEVIVAIRTIMLSRARVDFGDDRFTMEIIQPRGDFCVTVHEDTGGDYLEDPRALQRQLDDACARFADCLGV